MLAGLHRGRLVVMLPMSRILKFVFGSILNDQEKRLATSLLELFRLKVGKHLVACTAVLYHLLETWEKISASGLSGPFISGFMFTAILKIYIK